MLVIAGIALALAVLLVAVKRRPTRLNAANLGLMSEQWLTAARRGRPHDM